ncbi:hypothetical protein I4U23_013558 [Adineta vaga]|nr:hypothetical protein I4U23_013558 [Adineta vaga]
MKIFLNIFFVYVFIVSIHGDFNVTQQVPSATLTVTNATVTFLIEINQFVNRPSFSARICVFNVSSNTSVYQMDVSNANASINYVNKTLTFVLPQYFYTSPSEFYITFDAGVFFSNSTINSTARNDTLFWHLKVIDLQTSTSMLYPSTYPSTITAYTAATSLSTNSTANTTTVTVTTTTTTTTTINQTSQSTLTTTMIIQANTDEPSPTRSAQLGMGLGITFISIAIIAEIIYFKYCYSGGDRSGSYYT